MCGIFAIFSRDGQPIKPRMHLRSMHSLRELAYRESGRQRHRGPDSTGVKIVEEHGVAMVHERLRIVGVEYGDQPFVSDDGDIILVANGEIYNYLELSAEIAKRRQYKPKSDCHVILELYKEYGQDLLKHIVGMFAFALYDKKTKKILLARDPIGIIPMYCGEDSEGNLWVSSEMKCLVRCCEKVWGFPPGEAQYGPVNGLKTSTFFVQLWMNEIPTLQCDLTLLRSKLESAVRTHLHCDVNFGALLSGGVDSSLIASIATNIMRDKYDSNYRLKTFSVGLRDAPDFEAARKVANYINSDHKELVFEIEDALDGIRDIVYHLETYDVTTVRCSLPMLFLTRYIKSTGIKMILSGEGADEIFGGYLYFHNAPSTEEFHLELLKRVQQLHHSDCLRANKVAMAKGIELRVPFLDTAFLNYVMSIRPQDKIPGKLNEYCGAKSSNRQIEKYVLRAAFADNYLPSEVLWRQKEQFSDGVGYAWIDTIRQVATSHVTNEMFAKAAERFPHNTPSTKEAYYYRDIFEQEFPGESAAKTVKKWVPRQDWGCPEDPSGRAQAVHQINQD